MKASAFVYSFAATASLLLTPACGDDDAEETAYSCCLIEKYCTECQRITDTWNPGYDICLDEEEALAASNNEQACSSEIEASADGYYSCSSDEESYNLTKARVACAR